MAATDQAHYSGPSPTGKYYYTNLATGDINESDTPPTPNQRATWAADNPQSTSGTVGQTQATSEPNQTIGGPVPVYRQDQINQSLAVQDNAVQPAPTSDGVGAGTTGNSATSVDPDDSPRVTASSIQSSVNTSVAALNQLITTQPNQLDQYTSYTYNIGWYLLSQTQYTAMVDSQKADTAGWQLLMQSGGAPVKGRSPAFPVDYYMDDLEINSRTPGGGTNRSNSALDLRFKVTEPNGITLLESIFTALKSVYKNDKQSQTNTSNNGAPVATVSDNTGTPNYLAAQYCLVIEFFGYDQNGKLVAPAKGTFSSTGGYGQEAVIKKYYPFRIMDIKFQVANRAIEYQITGMSLPQSYASTTDRGTIPFPFTLTGQTVEQLLNGSPAASGKTSASSGTSTADKGARKTTPEPIKVGDLPIKQQAAIAAGTDPNAVNDQGMAFGGGGLSGA